jgi:transmembrane sensor
MSARTHAIYDRAASWIVQSEAPDWTEERQAELEMWLGESYGHRAAYLRLLSSWRAADMLAGQEPEVIADDEVGERPAGRSFPFLALAASFLAFAVIGSVLWLLSISATNIRGDQIASGSAVSASEQFVTQVGARAIIPLSDGSQIELNTDSAMRVHMGSSRREVWLDRGEAYFEVAHHEDVPFVVHAGERNVTVLGTRFAIRREPDKLTVAVAQGRN